MNFKAIKGPITSYHYLEKISESKISDEIISNMEECNITPKYYTNLSECIQKWKLSEKSSKEEQGFYGAIMQLGILCDKTLIYVHQSDLKWVRLAINSSGININYGVHFVKSIEFRGELLRVVEINKTSSQWKSVSYLLIK